jgi:formylglycine-generating enzyme required for sulfatase activity
MTLGVHAAPAAWRGSRLERWPCLVTLLLLGLGGCEHKRATASPPPVLRVPSEVPAEEPAPAPLLVPEGGETPATQVAADVRPSDSRPAADAAGEFPCAKEPPAGMVCIPGGPFWRGSEKGAGKSDERPRMRIVVSPVFLDTYEVTNAQYFQCVEAKKCAPPIKYYRKYARPQQPVVAVSWYEADDYCKYAGKRLPTEAEWEKAARGPSGDIYPWGNEPATCERAVYEEPLGKKGCGTDTTADVGSRPVGRYGLYDMAGNSWEWVNDWKADCYQGCKNACGADCDGPDPRGPCGGGPAACAGFRHKVLKGGSWFFGADRMRGAERRGVSPSNRGPHRLGFRCAKTVSP